MSRVDELFSRFAAEYRERGWADPRPLLAALDDDLDRAELSLRIDGFLERNAARRFAGEAELEAAIADPLVQQLVDAAAAAEDAADLVTLRHSAEIQRDELTRRLAEELGVADRADEVHGYYHRLERGQLEVERVRPAVFEALGRVLEQSAGRLRSIAQRVADAASGGGEAVVFARAAAAPPPAAPAAPAAPADEVLSDEGAPPDEVDDLFQGNPVEPT